MHYIGIIVGCIIGSVVVYAVGYKRRINKMKQSGKIDEVIAEEERAKKILDSAECCGAHAICEKGLKKASDTIEYFDDDNLDNYINRTPESYNDSEIDEFREVLYTLKHNEVEAWLISLEKRNVELPLVLRQEALDMIDNKNH